MADDIFALGFGVDTSGLQQAKVSASELAKALAELAKAMKAEEDAAAKAAAAEKKIAEEAKKAAQEAERAANPHLRLADTMSRIGQQAQGAAQGLGGLGNGFVGLGNSLSSPQGLNAGLGGLSSGLAGIAARLGPVGAGVALVAAGVLAMGAAVSNAAVAMAKQQEEFLLLEARLKNVYQNANTAKAVFADLTELANKNGVAINVVADGYLRLARTNESIGLTRKQMLELTDSVQMLGRVSNASQGELQGGLMQFSQALAAGRLNGDELRSIMENLPALAQAIAEGMGKSVGQIRAMGAAGELTSDKITKALLSQLPKIREEFDALPNTSDQAFTRVGNAWDSLIAHMSEKLHLSGIVTGFGEALAYVIEGADNLITAETDQQRYERLSKMGAYSPKNHYRTVGTTNRTQEQEADFNNLRYAAGMQALNDAYEGGIAADKAAISRAMGVGSEVEKLAKQRTEIENQIRTIKDGIAAAQRTQPGEEQQSAVAAFARQLEALEKQLRNIKTPLQTYIETTSKMRAGVAVYGAGGAASIATEAQTLFDAGAKAGGEGNMSLADATSAVLDRRVASTQEQTAAMDQQIAVQQRLMEAIGGGTDAQIEAEVANKALTLQMQMFGAVMSDDATKALEEYKTKLRELLQIQNDTTAAQKLYNAQLQLGIEAQITAAIKAGATAGEIAALRRTLQLGVDMSQAGGGNFPASLLTSESGGNPSALNAQGYGGRLQFGDARLADAAKAGIIPLMTGAEFSQQPLEVQQRVENWHFADIDRQAEGRGLTKYIGQTINGTVITQNGIRAMAHLGGIGGTQAYLESGGTVDPADANGTRLSDYSRMHGGSSVAQQAVTAEAELEAERLRQTAEQRIAQLEKEAAALREQAGAGNLSEAARIKREQQITAAGEAFADPVERKRVEDATRAKLEAEDTAKAQERLRAIEAETELMKQQAALAKLPAREREIELRVLERINEAKASGKELSEAEIALIRQQYTEQARNEKLIESAKANADRFKGVWNSAAESIGSSLEEAISQAMENGKIDAKEILNGLVKDITMSLLRAYVVKPLVEGIQGFVGAQGLAITSEGPVMRYAQGGALPAPVVVPALTQPMNADNPVVRYAHGGAIGASIAVPAPGIEASESTPLMRYAQGGTLNMTAALPLQALAAGGIVARETLVETSGRRALIGEAGPEAAIPATKRGVLARTDDGKYVDLPTTRTSGGIMAVRRDAESMAPAKASGNVIVMPLRFGGIRATDGLGRETVMPVKRGQDGILAVSLSRNQLQDHHEAENNPRKETASSLIDRMVERQAALTLRMTDAEPKKSETFRQFAQGGVVASPVVFPMAQGAGLMGEAGPEAVLPLKRGPDGKLGVGAGQGAGGGTQIIINDMRTTAGAEPVEVQETSGPDGQRMISILVRDEVRRQVRNGDLDKEMRASFGVSRQLTRR